MGQPTTILPPCAVLSPMRAAGLPPINTVAEPIAITSGGPVHTHISPTQAAGCPPMSTVGVPGGSTGPPTCGTGGVPGVTIGHTCISPILAAGWDIISLAFGLCFLTYEILNHLTTTLNSPYCFALLKSKIDVSDTPRPTAMAPTET